jgi:bacteriorhodopsin
MDWHITLHWIYVGVMAIGTLYFASLGTKPRGVPKYEYLVAIFIPIWSGLAYMTMALDRGKVEFAGQITYYTRYIDWIVTTPLLLLALSWTAMHYIPKDKTLIAGLMGTDVIMLLCGLMADLTPTSTNRYRFYIRGLMALLVLMWLIWVPLRAKTRTQKSELTSLFDKLASYFTVLWMGYPIAWLIGPSGLSLVNQTIDTLLFCVLSFLSKIGFSFLNLHGLRNLNTSRSWTVVGSGNL